MQSHEKSFSIANCIYAIIILTAYKPNYGQKLIISACGLSYRINRITTSNWEKTHLLGSRVSQNWTLDSGNLTGNN